MTRTLNSPLSAAELCRRNHWGPGTRLAGEVDDRWSVITITAIGREEILAFDERGQEGTRDLTDRAWQVIPGE